MLRTMGAVLTVCAGMGVAASGSAQQQQVKVVKISDSIYMAPVGSNVYLVTTPEGNVVIDTAPEVNAQIAKDLLTEVSHAPVKYIVLTHGHADHIGGISLWKQPGTQIIAQRNYVELVNYVARLEGFFVPRNAVAFGRPAQQGARGRATSAPPSTRLFFSTRNMNSRWAASSLSCSARRAKRRII